MSRVEIHYTPNGGPWNSISVHVGMHRIGVIRETVRRADYSSESRAECWRCSYCSRWRAGTEEERVAACKLAIEKHVYQKHHELMYPI